MCRLFRAVAREQTTRRGFLSSGPNVQDYGKEAVKTPGSGASRTAGRTPFEGQQPLQDRQGLPFRQ